MSVDHIGLESWKHNLRVPELLLVIAAFLMAYFPVIDTVYFSGGREFGGDTSGILVVVASLLFIYRIVQFWSDQQVYPGRFIFAIAVGLLVFGFSAYVLGNMLYQPMLMVGSAIPVAGGVVLLFIPPGQRKFFTLSLILFAFAVPLPFFITDAVIFPLKLLVSKIVEEVLFLLEYPVSRDGVILTIGHYQLLVADACSGINSLFSLEALGMLYVSQVRYRAKLRGMILAVLIVPVSITANVTRVIMLVLMTYYLGNDVAQGFMHDFSGILLFLIALGIIFTIDNVVLKVLKSRDSSRDIKEHA